MRVCIAARIGQGDFRTKVLELWSRRCSVTRSETLCVIRASHIKPWRLSTNEERLDPFNGLPLVANLDALFDAGLISFAASGVVLASPVLPEPEQQIFGIRSLSLSMSPSERTAQYLAFHREHIFQKKGPRIAKRRSWPAELQA
jgi:hypothetical protein